MMKCIKAPVVNAGMLPTETPRDVLAQMLNIPRQVSLSTNMQTKLCHKTKANHSRLTNN
jgi:hypothetical protein